MKPYKTIMIKNGDELVPYDIYECEECGKVVEESHPKTVTEDGVFCWDCSFIKGLISDQEYMKCCGVYLSGMRAAVHDGKIYVVTRNRKFPWEKSKKRQRTDPNYIRWRKDVFERDGYKCQICGKVGGTLNAHHIKPFATNEELRFDIDNGVTLCEKCHKEVHKRRDEEWIK